MLYNIFYTIHSVMYMYVWVYYVCMCVCSLCVYDNPVTLGEFTFPWALTFSVFFCLQINELYLDINSLVRTSILCNVLVEIQIVHIKH